MRNMKKSVGNSSLIEKNSELFQPLLFSSNSVKEHVLKKSNITGTWAETVDIFYSCASLLNTEKVVYFKPTMITDSCSSITTKKQCNFLFFNIK